MYTKPEDEFFHRRAAWSFTFDTPAKGGATDDLQPMRLVMAVHTAAGDPAAHKASTDWCLSVSLADTSARDREEIVLEARQIHASGCTDWPCWCSEGGLACQGLDTAVRPPVPTPGKCMWFAGSRRPQGAG